MVVLHHPLTTRSTRVEAERRLRKSQFSACCELNSFETIWLGYRLPYTTEDEQEDPRHVFHDHDRLNFMKCVWTTPSP